MLNTSFAIIEPVDDPEMSKALTPWDNHDTFGTRDIIREDKVADQNVIRNFPARRAAARPDQDNRIDRTFEENISHAQTSGDRLLVTILMSDVVNSAGVHAPLSEAQSKQAMDELEIASVRTVLKHEGTLIGDGLLAAFPRPSAAIACARELQSEAGKSGLTIRAGIHSGECLCTANTVTGIAVAIAARVLSEVPGGQVWVSRTVRELVLGSDLEFINMGSKKLEGLSDEWTLYQLLDGEVT